MLASTGTASKPVSLPEGTSELWIDNMQMIADPDGTIQWEQIRSGKIDRKFDKIESKNLPVGRNAGGYWLKFEIRNDGDLDNEWIFDFKRWSRVEFYTINANGEIRRQVSGNFLPVRERDVAFGDQVWIAKKLKSGESETCVVHLQFDPSSSAGPVRHGFRIQTMTSAMDKQAKTNAIVFLLLGVFLVMFLYNLFVYFSTRDINYLYYLMVVAGFATFTLTHSGNLFSLLEFWTWLPAHRSVFNSANLVLTGSGSILFVTGFLNLRKQYPKWFIVFRILLVAVILAPLTRIFLEYTLSSMIANMISICLIISILSVIVIGVIHRLPSASYLICGVSVSAIGSFISICGAMGIFPFNPITEIYAIATGSVIEMILFSFALANKIKILRKENERQQKQMIAQLRENKRLQEDINEELEREIADRTQKIVQQKELIEREKNKAEKLLLNILPRSTAEELKEFGKSRPRRHDEATVLFTDFQDFTQLSSLMTVDEIHSRLDHCFQVFDHLSEECHVEKIKTIGDSYMCVAGVPGDDPDHALHAVRLGLKIRDFINQWNDENEHCGMPRWEIRIGIHSGPLISGVVGNKKLSFDIWGNTVNVASRMEKYGEIRKVNVSQVTYELVNDRFRFESRGKISISEGNNMEMHFAEHLNSLRISASRELRQALTVADLKSDWKSFN